MKEQNLAVFGVSGSGKTVLLSSFYRASLRWNRDAERAGIPAKVFCASMADVFEDHPDVAAPRQRLSGLIEATPWADLAAAHQVPREHRRDGSVGRRMAAPRLGGRQRGEPALCR